MRRTLAFTIAPLGFAAALVLGAGSTSLAACVGGSPNGTLQSGEQCDGGTDPDDCCTDQCSFAADNTACDDNNDCSVNSKCDASGDCGGGTGAPNGTTCRQRDVNGTPEDCKSYACQGKACTSTVVTDPCSDGNACTEDTCTNPTTVPPTCSPNHPALPENAPCDTDQDACTIEKCDALAACNFIEDVDCSGETPAPGDCEEYLCDPADGSCNLEDKQKGTTCSSDGNDCTDDECNSRGDCKHYAVNAGKPCSDGNVCSIGEQCNSQKVCGPAGTEYAGSPVNDGRACPDEGNICTYDYCLNGTTTCGHSPNAYAGGGSTNGIPCTDANTCTVDPTCQNGACKATSCAAGNCAAYCGNPACGTDPALNCSCAG